MQIIFLSGTKCLWLAQYVNKFLVRHQKFGPSPKIWTSTKHFATCKRTRHKHSPPLLQIFQPIFNLSFRVIYLHFERKYDSSDLKIHNCFVHGKSFGYSYATPTRRVRKIKSSILAYAWATPISEVCKKLFFLLSYSCFLQTSAGNRHFGLWIGQYLFLKLSWPSTIRPFNLMSTCK